MNVTTDRTNGISVVHVNEARLTYLQLSAFATAVIALIGAGERRVLVDLSNVTAVDSATVGCLMDLSRQTTEAGGLLKLSGVQKRVEKMLTMTGAQAVLDVHPDASSALRSFGS